MAKSNIFSNVFRGSGDLTVADIAGATRFAAGVKVLTVGDSIIEFADRFAASGLALEHQIDSEIMWAGLRLSQGGGPRFRHYIWQDGSTIKGANQGVAGDEPYLVLQRIDAILTACDAPIVVLNIGTNAGSPDDQATPAIANLELLVEKILAANRVLILGTVRPRKVDAGGYPTGSYLWQRRLDINTWIRAQKGRPGIVIWDMDQDMLKTSGATDPGEAASDVLVDEVHLNPRGAFVSSKSLASALASVIAPGTFFPALAGTTLNIFPNGQMASNAGTIGTGVTGEVANGWTAERSSGSTITAVASKPSGNHQQFVITSATTPTATNVLRFRHTATTALSALLNTYSADTWWQLGMDVECSAWAGFAYPQLLLYDAGGGINYSAGKPMSTGAPEGGVNENWRGVLAPPPLKRASWSNLRARLDTGIYVGNHPVTGSPISGTGTLTVRGAWLFQTDNPEVLFPI